MATKLEELPQSVADLLAHIVTNQDWAMGRRRYPRTVTKDDAFTIAEAFQEQVDRGVETRAELGRRKLMVIACHRGCNTCCEEPIMVTLPEAIVVARWITKPENAAVLAGFLARFPAWQADVGERLERLSVHSSKGESEPALELHVEARHLCPFNDAGECTIYPARPILCRDAHALDTPEHCAGWSGGTVKCIPFPQLDEFIKKVKTAMWAIHHALPGTKRLQMIALPAAVHQLLGEMGALPPPATAP
jgi:Fe-S-cluster containining protein